MLSGARVLVADDDLVLLRSVATGLTHLGAEVTRAANGAELLYRLAHDGPFDLVLADIAMPWMSGVEAMHAIKSVAADTSVIVMTGLDEKWVRDGIASLGSHAALLRKPFDLTQLESAVSMLLERRRARVE
ncbi:MAG TPA: response regulator [Vicinamibacterales bacterium]|jgi:CheY-like chemotaxis protein